MKISLQWLKRWLPDLSADGDGIADALTSLGIEVEEIIGIGVPRKHLAVGEVESFVQHPRADRLRLCRVSVGGEKPLQIVCGASNFAIGDRVPVAIPGCLLPNGAAIGATVLRGETSEGMLCSAEELHLSGGENGILILDRRWPIGTPLSEVFPDCDTVLDLSITANRGDCMSHLGIARELAAYFHLKLSDDVYCPENVQFPTNGGEDFLLDDLRLESPDCHKFMAWSIRDLCNGQSPQWLRHDLEKIGMRSICAAVDVTNWLMADCGQPLHAFDGDKIRGRVLRIRRAIDGESMVALNHRKYDLRSDMMVVADGERPLVIAGTMGSVDGEVDGSTRNIVLECAAFKGAAIQVTSKKLGLISDSSQRFARGVDVAAMDYCARRAVKMIIEVCGGRACTKPQVAAAVESGGKNLAIALGGDFVRKNYGAAVEDETIENSLRSLHFGLEKIAGGWSVSVPPFRRRDVTRPIDLVEEFIRFHGLDELSGAAPNFTAIDRRDENGYSFAAAAANHMIANGFSECYNYSTVDGSAMGCGGESWDELAIANPLTADQNCLRSSLLPGIVAVAAANMRNGNGIVKFFEVGRVWVPCDGKLHEAIAVGWVHFNADLEGDWYRWTLPDFYGMKAIGKQLAALADVAVADIDFVPAQCRMGENGYWSRHGLLGGGGHDLRLGLLSQTTCCEYFGVPASGAVLCGGELRIVPDLLRVERKSKKFNQFANFPCAVRDLAVAVESSVPAEMVRLEVERCLEAVCSGNGVEASGVRIFDAYGPGFAEGGDRNIALRLTLNRSNGTLTEEEIGEIFDAVIARLETKFQIRRKDSAPNAAVSGPSGRP
ncbi:MAG: phenylalanine--tRNA ligase subunit beta [Puniceicoccales bacterium]|nr:phenylalanine--tRNA ligase subunit beta [Puniceicoccales bacterium]